MGELRVKGKLQEKSPPREIPSGRKKGAPSGTPHIR